MAVPNHQIGAGEPGQIRAGEPGKSSWDARATLGTEDFVELITTHHRALYKFIYSLLPNRDDAEDVLQQTNVVLLRKFGEFVPGTDFLRWAARVAHFKVREFRRSQARNRLRFWDEEVIDAIARTSIERADLLVERQRVLPNCIEKLPTRDRELVRRRYETSATIKVVAEQLGRPANTVYKALARIHRALYACIEQSLAGANR